MTADNMRSVATYTIFSFLLLMIAMFLVFYRYDLYNGDTGAFIRIGFIVGGENNATKKDKVTDVKLHTQTSHITDVLDTHVSDPKNTKSDAIHKAGTGQPSGRDGHFYEQFLAILATRSQHGDNDGKKEVEITTEKPSNNDEYIRRIISKLDESKDEMKKPEIKSDSAQSVEETISVKPKVTDREKVNGEKNPSASQSPKLSGSVPSTKKPKIKEHEHNKQIVSYPAERLPSPVPAISPPKSWPSLFLPDSGFADSSEISPFSLFTRIADMLNSSEDDQVQASTDSQEMWQQFDDISDFLISPRKRFLQGHDSKFLNEEEDSDSNDDEETKDLFDIESTIPIFFHQNFDLPLQI